MKVNFPNISIDNVNKKVYAVDLSGGGQEPFNLRLNYVDDIKATFNLDTISPIEVRIGSFFTFKGYAVSFSKKQSVSSGTTCELVLVDTSIILDKLWVGLKGKHGGGQPLIKRSVTLANTTAPPLVNLNTLYSTQRTDPKTNGLSVFLADPNDSDLILLGSYIDPCADQNNDQVTDECDPCSDIATSKIDCQKSRSFEILDVDYSFSELKAALDGRVSFGNNINLPTNYRAQYTGSLREVLNNWCQDFGWTFYWDNNANSIFFINLSTGINIDDLNLENTLNCKIEEFSESRSIEDIKKTVNIAYYGKAGEVKNYTCSSTSAAPAEKVSAIGVARQCTPITTTLLFANNKPLEEVYENQETLETVMAASRLGENLRRIVLLYNRYKFKNLNEKLVGIYPLLGWDVKAVIHKTTQDSQVKDGYDATTMRSFYSLLSKSESLFDKEFLKTAFINESYYFLIVKPYSEGGFTFEKNLCEKFAGVFSYDNPRDNTDVQYSSDDGEVTDAPPDLSIGHKLIRSNAAIVNIHNDQKIVTVKGSVTWPSNPDDESVDKFLKIWSKKVRKIELPLFEGINLSDGDELWMLPAPGVNGSINYENISFALPPENNPQGTRRQYTATTIGGGGGGGSNSQGGTTLIIPKIEIIKSYPSQGDGSFTSIEVNYQNITNNNLSNIIRGTRSCYIDQGKIINYANVLMKDLNTNFTKEKITKTYSILGLPNQLYTFADGLTSFSIRLDQSGTRTSVSFSNLFPSKVSDNVKQNQLNYLIKNNSNNKYINNTFK